MPAQASVRIPVRWRDLDLLGHLNQAVYHEYLEEGRAALMASLGEGIRFPFVLARVELDYRAEVRPVVHSCAWLLPKTPCSFARDWFGC